MFEFLPIFSVILLLDQISDNYVLVVFLIIIYDIKIGKRRVMVKI